MQSESRQQYGLVVDGRPVMDDAPKVNWNHLHCTFRPRSGRLPTGQQFSDNGDESSWAVGFSATEGRPPSSLSARPKSAGFPARFHRRAKRPPGASSATAASAANDSDDELAEMWRLDDEDNVVELDEIFDQLTRRGAAASQQQLAKKKKAQRQQQQQQQQHPQHQRPWRPRTASKKSATQLYQEHLLAEIAKHRLKATAHQRPPPPELSLFIPKTRTRLCRLYTGPSLLRGGSNPVPPPLGGSSSSSLVGNGFVPIARPLFPLAAELRPQSRQQAGYPGLESKGGSAQVSGSACNCGAGSRPRTAMTVAAARGGRVVSSYTSDCCAVCQRLRMLQLA